MGATSKVTAAGSTRQAAAILATIAGVRRLAGLEHADDRVGRLAKPDHVVDRLGAGRGPHRAGTHREELAVLQRPAGVLAGQAGLHRMIGDDLDQRGCPAADLARHDRHLRQVAQADPSQLDPRDQAAACLDPAVDVAPAPFDRMHGDPAVPRRGPGVASTTHRARRFNDIVMLLIPSRTECLPTSPSTHRRKFYITA